MAAACALAMFSGKIIIIICGSETPAGVSEPLFSVKKGFQKVRRLFGSQNKNNFSLNYAQSSAEGISNRPTLPKKGFMLSAPAAAGCARGR
jgi:hypothetical protein